jgi:hypothetical protein
MATSAAPIVTRSSSDRGRIAEITPIGIATIIQITNAPAVSESVTGSRVKICDFTETLFWYE